MSEKKNVCMWKKCKRPIVRVRQDGGLKRVLLCSGHDRQANALVVGIYEANLNRQAFLKVRE